MPDNSYSANIKNFFDGIGNWLKDTFLPLFSDKNINTSYNANSSANNQTFGEALGEENNSSRGESPAPSNSGDSEVLSPTYSQSSGEVNTGNDNKDDLSYGDNAGAGTGEGTVTPPVETPSVVTPPTDTSGSEGGGTSTPTDTTIDSYYDYLKTEMPEHLKGIYNDTIAAIDQANAKTIAEINAAKERGIVDANTSYQHNLSTYGAKNEALRGMGLAGSGYSEYLDSQAYATQRAEVQGVKAGALAAENEANSNAENAKLEAKKALDESTLYYDNFAEEHLENKYSEILKGAGDGTYSKEQIENLAGYYGIDPEQSAQLVTEAQQYKQNTQINEINDYIDIGDYDTALKLADKYYNNGNGTIDQDTYQKAYFDFWANGISSRGSATVADIKQDIADIDNQKKAGKLSSADANALKQYIYACAGGKLSSSSYSVKNSYSIVQREGEFTRVYITLEGKEYEVTIDKDSKKISKQVADASTTGVLNSIVGTSSPTANTLVMLDGSLYIFLKNDSVPKYNEWVKVSDTNGLYSKYNTLCGYQAKPTKPTHSTGSTSSSRSAGGYNGSGMSVRVHQMQ